MTAVTMGHMIRRGYDCVVLGREVWTEVQMCNSHNKVVSYAVQGRRNGGEGGDTGARAPLHFSEDLLSWTVTNAFECELGFAQANW